MEVRRLSLLHWGQMSVRSSIQLRLVECCIGDWPSGTFSHLHRISGNHPHWVLGHVSYLEPFSPHCSIWLDGQDRQKSWLFQTSEWWGPLLSWEPSVCPRSWPVFWCRVHVSSWFSFYSDIQAGLCLSRSCPHSWVEHWWLLPRCRKEDLKGG